MAEKTATPPPTTATVSGSSSPATPAAKRNRMNSSARASKEEPQAGSEAPQRLPSARSHVAAQEVDTGLFAEADDVEADDAYADSAFGTDQSDTTSLASSIFKGLVENGRRYQTVREGEYWGPSDDKQFESLQAGHIVYMLLDSGRKNPYFYSPVAQTAQNILDVGTGPGDWAKGVADMYPSASVTGVDLYPPPDTWVPTNCKLEVDDVLKTWTWPAKWDLIHMRDLYGSFTDEQWRLLYKQAYKNLKPGGWIEQLETGIHWKSDDGSVAPDSLLGKWGDLFTRSCNRMGKNINTVDTFKAAIEVAGFTNAHEKLYKAPVGEWAKNPVLKEAGRYQKQQVLEGLEGYVMYILTKFGDPEPWTPEEVHVFLAKVRQEFAHPALHCYVWKRRVWAQKPFDSEPSARKPEVEVENVA